MKKRTFTAPVDSTISDIIRLTKIIEGYEALIEFIFEESYIVSNKDILEYGLNEVLDNLKYKIILDNLGRNGQVDGTLCKKLGISRATVYTWFKRYGKRRANDRLTSGLVK